MGLAFLNKKSWHTGSFQNIEKVWIAEKKREDEDKRTAERTKKLKEERQNEELKRLQVQAGLLPASVLDRQEWIYEWGNKVQDQSKEEYLLGKPVQQQKEERDSKKYPFTPLLKEGFANPQNEAFVKLHEDPLFMIKQEEMKRRKEIIDNPLQMREIYKQIEGKDKPKKVKKDKKEKKEKKEKKRKEKKEKKEKKSRRDSPSESRSPSRSKKRSSKRDVSSSSSRSKSRSKDRSRERERHSHHHHHSSKSRDHRDHHKEHKDHKEKDISRESTSHTSGSKSTLFNEYLKKKLGPNVSIDANTFKPDFGINKRKRKESQHHNSNSQVSHEDRQKMIDEMKKNAEDLTKSKLEQLKDRRDDDEGKEKSGGIFITKMRNDVYGKKSEITDLGDQIARNVHYLERGGDSKNSFRK